MAKEMTYLPDRIEGRLGRIWTKQPDGGIKITQPSETTCEISPSALARQRQTLVARLQRAQKELDWFDKRTQDVAALQATAVESLP